MRPRVQCFNSILERVLRTYSSLDKPIVNLRIKVYRSRRDYHSNVDSTTVMVNRITRSGGFLKVWGKTVRDSRITDRHLWSWNLDPAAGSMWLMKITKDNLNSLNLKVVTLHVAPSIDGEPEDTRFWQSELGPQSIRPPDVEIISINGESMV